VISIGHLCFLVSFRYSNIGCHSKTVPSSKLKVMTTTAQNTEINDNNNDIISSFVEQTDPKTLHICVALFSVIWSIEWHANFLSIFAHSPLLSRFSILVSCWLSPLRRSSREEDMKRKEGRGVMCRLSTVYISGNQSSQTLVHCCNCLQIDRQCLDCDCLLASFSQLLLLPCSLEVDR